MKLHSPRGSWDIFSSSSEWQNKDSKVVTGGAPGYACKYAAMRIWYNLSASTAPPTAVLTVLPVYLPVSTAPPTVVPTVLPASTAPPTAVPTVLPTSTAPQTAVPTVLPASTAPQPAVLPVLPASTVPPKVRRW